MEHFFPRIQMMTKKQRFFTKHGTSFFLEFKWRPALIIKGDTVKLLGECIHPIPPGLGSPGMSETSFLCGQSNKLFIIFAIEHNHVIDAFKIYFIFAVHLIIIFILLFEAKLTKSFCKITGIVCYGMSNFL